MRPSSTTRYDWRKTTASSEGQIEEENWSLWLVHIDRLGFLSHRFNGGQSQKQKRHGAQQNRVSQMAVNGAKDDAGGVGGRSNGVEALTSDNKDKGKRTV